MKKVKFFVFLGVVSFACLPLGMAPRIFGLSNLPAEYVSCSWAPGKVIVDVNVPNFNIKDVFGAQSVYIEGFNNLSDPGKPVLPFKVLTLAIPPDAAVQSVEVNGTYTAISGTYNIEPAPAEISLALDSRRQLLRQEEYNKNKQNVYFSNTAYPSSKGELLSTGGLRKYNLAMVAVYPVLYNPVKEELQYTSHLQVVIHYTKDAGKEAEYERLASDNVADLEASELIYNFTQAKEWYPYKPREKGKATYDYVIITTAALAPACTTIANWKTVLGYKVNLVTKGYIDSNYTGTDIQQKIRNFLRANYESWATKYVLIVGNHADIPMRMCYTQSNTALPSWAIDAYDYPILTDLYYADLTSADASSWNKDGDTYWGEALTAGGSSGGNDSPDYVTEVALGRIPWSDASRITSISQKIRTFEQNTTLSYKKKALFAQSIIQFSSTVDAAAITESLISNSIISSGDATKLYEKKGRVVSSYSCTDSLTKVNLKSRCQGMGILALCAHGWVQTCARLIWVTDNGDGVAQQNELGTPELLSTLDLASLDNTHPANAFLQSCIVGYPETQNNLGAALLYQGCISVVAASRSIFTSLTNAMQYYFFNKLLKDTTISHAKTGPALNLARQNYASGGSPAQNMWPTMLALNLYGDPSLCHFGTTVGIEENASSYTPYLKINVFPNPFGKEVTIKSSIPLNKVSLGIYDISGRLVKSFSNIKNSVSSVTWDASNSPAGIYFVRLNASLPDRQARDAKATEKLILMK